MIEVQKITEVPPWERTVPLRNVAAVMDGDIKSSLNDDGNALRFEQECKGYLVYDLDSKEWYAWVKNRWEPAEMKLLQSARFVVNSLLVELEYLNKQLRVGTGSGMDKEFLKPLIKKVHEMESHIKYSKKLSNTMAMVNFCAGASMAVHLCEISDFTLIAFKNGVLDTRAGVIYSMDEASHLKYRYPTRYIDCEYNPDLKPDQFEKHLRTVFKDNTRVHLDEKKEQNLIDASVKYFRRLLGYSLYPGNPLQIMVFCIGNGSNGKSTTFNVIWDVLKNEMSDASVKELYVNADNRATPRISEGLGKCLLLFTEASDDEGEGFNVGKICRDIIKVLTGEEITSLFRKFYRAGVLQRILCLPVALTNEMPHFDKDPDKAFLRRIIVIPFNHDFEVDLQKNITIKEVLKTERDAIFSLMVNELFAYLKEGLCPLPEEWKADRELLLSDPAMHAFINDSYVKTDGNTPEERVWMVNVESEAILWFQANNVDRVFKREVSESRYVDATGTLDRLTKGDQRLLHKTFLAMGFKIGRGTANKAYVCCTRKPASQHTLKDGWEVSSLSS